MLEDFFSAEELISNIRIIQKTKMKQNEKYELVSISNHHSEQLILPVSDGSLCEGCHRERCIHGAYPAEWRCGIGK